ncbi:MAG: mercuric ion transporter MerT [Thermoanaerobaculia bacterium]
MDDSGMKRMRTAGLTAGIASAFAASICCIGPIAAATLGLTSLGALARYEGLRPLFGGLSLVFVGVAFFLTYRHRPEAVCDEGSVCDVHGVDRVQRVNRIVLWIAAIVTVMVLTFPTWSSWILG